MKSHELTIILLVLPCLLLGFASQALALRCGNGLVDVGATRIEVLKKCGEPALVDEWDEEETFRRGPEIDRPGEKKRRTVIVHVEQWVYNFGPTRFIYMLKFRNGVLAEITTGDHGY